MVSYPAAHVVKIPTLVLPCRDEGRAGYHDDLSYPWPALLTNPPRPHIDVHLASRSSPLRLLRAPGQEPLERPWMLLLLLVPDKD